MKFQSQKLLWIALGVITLLRFGIAAWVPLSPDEAYYWIWSKAPALSYYDHPPMVALWIKIGTFLFGHTAFGIRFLGPLSVFFGSIFLFYATCDFTNELLQKRKKAVEAVGLFNATLAIGVGSVTMTPDTPLLFFMCVFLWACGRLVTTHLKKWWWMIGFAFGLALLSKYTALLPALGLGLWCLITRQGRNYLRIKESWGAILLALLIFSPVIVWNTQYGFVSFLKQGGRTGDWNPHRALQYLTELIGGQIGLMTPLIFVFLVIGVIRLTKRIYQNRSDPDVLLWLMIMIPAAVFIQHAFGDRVQANWVTLIYPMLIVVATLFIRKYIITAILIGIFMILPIYAQAVVQPFSLPSKIDMTLKRLGGWQGLATTIEKEIQPNEYLLADDYGLASELAFYSKGRKIAAIEPRWVFFNLPKELPKQAILIRSQRRKDMPSAKWFSEVKKVGEVKRTRKQQIAESYNLYRVVIRQNNEVKQNLVQLP